MRLYCSLHQKTAGCKKRKKKKWRNNLRQENGNFCLRMVLYERPYYYQQTIGLTLCALSISDNHADSFKRIECVCEQDYHYSYDTHADIKQTCWHHIKNKHISKAQIHWLSAFLCGLCMFSPGASNAQRPACWVNWWFWVGRMCEWAWLQHPPQLCISTPNDHC